MSIYKIAIAALSSIFLFIRCSASTSGLKDEEMMIIGKWTGQSGGDTMILQFKDDCNVTFDYSKAGGKKNDYKYSFIKSNVISVSGWGQIKIKELNGQSVTFQPADKTLKESIDILYTIKFMRAND